MKYSSIHIHSALKQKRIFSNDPNFCIIYIILEANLQACIGQCFVDRGIGKILKIFQIEVYWTKYEDTEVWTEIW